MTTELPFFSFLKNCILQYLLVNRFCAFKNKQTNKQIERKQKPDTEPQPKTQWLGNK